MALYYQNKKLSEQPFSNEKEIEKVVVDNFELFFGQSSLFIEAKKKIDTKFLGSSIPDGFLFDLSDIDNPEFYLVEIEWYKHDFYNHIFPQITKFFSFFKNPQSISELIEKIFTVINTNNQFKKKLKTLIGDQEIFKFIKDTIENSQNILLVLDGGKNELPEIMETYTDTWGAIVKVLILKQFSYKDETVYSLIPDFNDIQYTDAETLGSKQSSKVFYLTEKEKVEQTSESARKAYYKIKEELLKINDEIIFNPQRYYLSVSFVRNIAFFKFPRKKIRLIIMLPEDEVRQRVKHHNVKSLSDSVQKFYNGPSCAIEILDDSHTEEIVELFNILINKFSN
jgi:hypothetical protein